MKTKLILLSLFFLAAALTLALTADAAIPHLMNFQGKATDKAGAPLNGTYNLTFRIYNTETAGTSKWTETQSSIQISNGIFQVQLGSVTPLSLPFDESYWISIEINTDGEMSPRTRLASVGYAYMAETSNTNNLPAGSVVQVVNYESGAVWTGAGASPFIYTPDTIPVITKGDEWATLAITPKSATNKLKIDVLVCMHNGSYTIYTAALFQDVTVNALASMTFVDSSSPNAMHFVTFTHYMNAGTTSSTIFRVRVGTEGTATTTVNGVAGGRKYGGTLASSITITEIKT